MIRFFSHTFRIRSGEKREGHLLRVALLPAAAAASAAVAARARKPASFLPASAPADAAPAAIRNCRLPINDLILFIRYSLHVDVEMQLIKTILAQVSADSGAAEAQRKTKKKTCLAQRRREKLNYIVHSEKIFRMNAVSLRRFPNSYRIGFITFHKFFMFNLILIYVL
jgi:hypothetical protein